jgi:hypothetical protein
LAKTETSKKQSPKYLFYTECGGVLGREPLLSLNNNDLFCREKEERVEGAKKHKHHLLEKSLSILSAT